MLFSIAGSQGTGKTTLINALQDKFPSNIPKTSRSILADWNVSLSEVNNNRQLTVKFQEEILKRKLADEASFVADPDNMVITERTFADLFCYALVALGKDNEYSDWLDDYFLQCKAAQESYTKVFFLKGGHFDPVNDGVRGANKHYSHMVDMVMLDYTEQTLNGFQLLTIHDGEIDRRVETVTKAMEVYKLRKNNE